MLMFSTAGKLAMARTLAALPEVSRITDCVSLATIFSFFLDDIVSLPFDSNPTKAGVSGHLGTNGVECTLMQSAFRDALLIRLFLGLLR